MFMDAIGMRPAMREVAERLATYGYVVLLPDLFYRSGPYVAPSMKAFFADAAVRTAWMKDVVGKATTLPDVPRYLDFLASQPDVAPATFGTTGYCMGGRLSFLAAATYPDRIAASAAYHPGGLVSDKPDSPHLLAPHITARIYIGAAREDSSFTDEQQHTLATALTDAKVDYVLEKYPAQHGWVPTDSPVHDAAAAAKHWQTLSTFFATTFASR